MTVVTWTRPVGSYYFASLASLCWGSMMADESNPDDFALCLSGGGLRATLFHLGLIKALRAHRAGGRTALCAVTEIYSVSGGSILAAHLVKNWDSYNGDDGQFAKMEAEVRAFAGRNIRDRVIRRWLLTRWLGLRRSYWLQKEYEALLGRGRIAGCYRQANGKRPPVLNILATSFKTGELCAFGPDLFRIMRKKDGVTEPIPTPGGHLRLAYAVTASSAFPPLFPPVPLTHKILGEPDLADFQTTIHLSDGGVFDNLGFEMLRMSRGSYSPQPGKVILSNAGASFRTDSRNRFVSMLSRNIRASDIMMRRVGESTEEAAAALPGVRFLPVRIGATVDDSALDEATQLRLRLVRTDLDRFDPELANMLIDHGFRVGSAIMVPEEWRADSLPPLLAAGESPDRLDEIAAAGGKRRTWSLALDFRDWKTLPLLWAIVLALGAGGFWGVTGFLAERRAEANKQSLAERIAPMQVAYANKDYDRLGLLLAEAAGNAEATERDPSRNIAEDPVPLDARAARATARSLEFEIPVQNATHNQRVYLQFAGVLTRAQIAALNQKLKSAGWAVQGSSGERLASSAGLNEVRFSGENEQAARDLAEAINAAGLTARPVEARRLSGIGRNLEAWISR